MFTTYVCLAVGSLLVEAFFNILDKCVVAGSLLDSDSDDDEDLADELLIGFEQGVPRLNMGFQVPLD